MTTIQEWKQFLGMWSEQWLAVNEDLPSDVRDGRWLGYEPATESQIEQLEGRLGYRLPPSYRAFLLTSNGWRQTSLMVEQLRPANEVEWLEVDDPQMLDVWDSYSKKKPYDGVSRAEYFSYDGRPIFDQRHFAKSLKIADPVPGDSAIYVLNPAVVTEDGEWEAWLHAHWIPGAERYPSFAHLMRAEYQSFRISMLGDDAAKSMFGPFDGVYAPDRARHKAKRIGKGKRKPRRLTVPELIDRLEDPSAKARLDAANHLFREFKPHDPDDEKPALVDQLVRILRSKSEADVRCAAACMLGSYGDQTAIGPLVIALRDAEVAASAVGALHYLSIYMKDSRIADGLYEYLGQPRDPTSTSTAMHILEDFQDQRLVSLALRMLDADINSQLLFQAAFAVASMSECAVDELAARLAHPNAEVRTAAAGALRHTEDNRAMGPLRAALKDSDPSVRIQATMSLRFFGEDIRVSAADEAEANALYTAKLRAAGINIPIPPREASS